MDKSHILAEIKRTAAENGGVPLGSQAFSRATGIRKGDWYGKYWARWGDALKEAGLEANRFQDAIPNDQLFGHLAGLVRELRHFPSHGEIRLRRHADPSFPCHSTFDKFGSYAELAHRVAEYCDRVGGMDDVARLCEERGRSAPDPAQTDAEVDHQTDFGFVYLLRSGRFYKIGKTNSAGRRERELAIQLPEKAGMVHKIRTDDPAGIEVYWHRRFEGKRRNGEWFDLDAADVVAFKRRKFM